MLAKICAELQNFHSDVIEVREKLHNIGEKIHDAYHDEFHLEHKYFYKELLNKNTFQRIAHSPKILKDKLFLKIEKKGLMDKRKLLRVKQNLKTADVKVVYW